jgi:DNA-binding response OmpR family regulator
LNIEERNTNSKRSKTIISTTNSDVTITLTLTVKEANWLKATVQNPGHRFSQDEPVEDKEMREKFFHALPDFST